MKIARLIIYEGTQEQLDKHLSQAKPDGLHTWSGDKVIFRIVTLPGSFIAALNTPPVINEPHFGNLPRKEL